MAKNKKKSSDESEKETKKSVKDDSAKESKKSKKEENVVSESKKSKKDKDSDKKEPGKIAKWFKDLKIEFKKVVWPSKDTVVTNTSVVLGVIALSAVLVGLLDELFLIIMRLIYNS
jgi:preprotein translocase subunit SecE